MGISDYKQTRLRLRFISPEVPAHFRLWSNFMEILVDKWITSVNRDLHVHAEGCKFMVSVIMQMNYIVWSFIHTEIRS